MKENTIKVNDFKLCSDQLCGCYEYEAHARKNDTFLYLLLIFSSSREFSCFPHFGRRLHMHLPPNVMHSHAHPGPTASIAFQHSAIFMGHYVV